MNNYVLNTAIESKNPVSALVTTKVLTLSALFIYLMIAYLYYGIYTLGYNDMRLSGVGDTFIYVWSLAWWKFALTHHLNVFISHYIWAPQGYNIARATTLSGIFFLTWPIQVFTNIETAYNLVFFSAPILAAWAMFMLCYWLTKHFLSALLGGYFYGFSGYMITQMYGHLNLTFPVFLLPILILFALLYLKQAINTALFVLGGSLALTWLFLISIEIFLTFTVVSSIGIITAYVMFKELRKNTLALVVRICAAYLITSLLVSPFLYYFFTDKFTGSYNLNLSDYSTDLLSFFVPCHAFLVNNTVTQHVTATIMFGNSAEQNAYLGIPLLIFIYLFIKTYWHKQFGKYMIILTSIFAFISLGPILKLSGQSIHTIYPMNLFFKLPLIKDAFPNRYMLYANLMIALMVAIYFKNIAQYAKYPLIILAMLFLMPTNNLNYYPRYTAVNESNFPAFFSAGLYKKWLVPNESVLIWPFNERALDKYYQVKSDFYFKLMGGHIGIFPADNTNLILEMYSNRIDKINMVALKQLLKERQVRHLIVLDDFYKKWQAVFAALQIKSIHVGGVRLFEIN